MQGKITLRNAYVALRMCSVVRHFYDNWAVILNGRVYMDVRSCVWPNG